MKRRADDGAASDATVKTVRPPPAATLVVLPHLKAYYSKQSFVFQAPQETSVIDLNFAAESLFPCELFYRWLSYGKGKSLRLG